MTYCKGGTLPTLWAKPYKTAKLQLREPKVSFSLSSFTVFYSEQTKNKNHVKVCDLFFFIMTLKEQFSDC